MKILQVISRADTIGGGQRHVLELSAALRERGHDLLVVTGPRGPFSDELKQLGLETREIDSLATRASPKADLTSLRSLAAIVDGARPDLVACHSTKAGVLGRIAARRAGIPVTYTLHGVIFGPDTARLRRIPGWLLEVAMRPMGAHLIAVSAFDASLAQQAMIVGRDHLHTVRNSVIDRDWRHEPDETPSVVMTARFEPQKDHETLLQALARLTELDWHLNLLGDGGGLETARARAGELGIADRVTFHGLVADIVPHLESAFVFVLATNYEGLPLSIIESMSCGLPVVATDVGGVAEAVRDGVNGMLVPRQDTTSLESALRTLLVRPELAAEMGGASRMIYDDAFGFSQFVDQTLAVYSIATTRA